MSLLRRRHDTTQRLPPLVLGAALVLGAGLAGPAAAATTTRFASPDGSASPSECTAMASPCTLPVALGAAQAGDTLSLAGGTYNLGRMTLPPVPLHWAPTDPRTRPVLTSPLAAPTLDLTAAQSGTSLQGLEVDNTNPGQFSNPQSFPPALRVGSGVAATVRSSILTSRTRCVEASGSGPLTIEDSTLSTATISFCALLGPQSTLRRSTVGRSAAELPASPPPVVVTQGLVEDSEVDGGLWLDAPTAVARRVRAIGATAIFGEGLVADSLARGFAGDGAAIAADGDAGGTLRVVNSTAVSTGGPALLSRPVESGMPVIPNDLVVTNSIARGKGVDIQATSSNDNPDCLNDEVIRCAIGLIHIDHSDFGTRAPLVTAPDAGVISEGAGNIAGDPLFADAANGDFHLRAGSPAIDAGAALDLALPTDLDGSARVQGGAPDLGALESAAPAGPPTVAGAGAGVGVGAVGSAAALPRRPERGGGRTERHPCSGRCGSRRPASVWPPPRPPVRPVVTALTARR